MDRVEDRDTLAYTRVINNMYNATFLNTFVKDMDDASAINLKIKDKHVLIVTNESTTGQYRVHTRVVIAPRDDVDDTEL